MTRIVGVIQARLGSERLPRKVLATVDGATVLEHVLARCRQAAGIDDWVVAVPAGDDDLIRSATDLGARIFAGDEHDVLRRFVGAATRYDADDVVRITADCPLIDPRLISDAVVRWRLCACDYLSYDGYPRGTGDIEVVSARALRRADAECTDAAHREHVTMHIYTRPGYTVVREVAPSDLHRPDLRVCVDQPEDLEVVRLLARSAKPAGAMLTVADVIRTLDEHPEWRRINSGVPQRT